MVKNRSEVVALSIGFLAALSCAVLYSAGRPCSAAGRAVLEAGFEEQAPGAQDPPGWDATRLPRTADHVVFAWDDTVAHSGSRSISIWVKPSHPNEQIAYNWTRTLDRVAPGKEYEVTGWVKTEDLTGPAFIMVQCWDAARTQMLGTATTEQAYPLSGTNPWTRVKTSFTVPKDTAEVRIRAGISSPQPLGGKVWFDDLRVEKK